MGIYEGKIEREREREREREITWDFLDLGHNSNSMCLKGMWNNNFLAQRGRMKYIYI
jgi:hypothetical protein